MSIYSKIPYEKIKNLFWVRSFYRGHMSQESADSIEIAIAMAQVQLENDNAILRVEIIESKSNHCVKVLKKDVTGNIVITS